ncbi:hypothetical protein AAD001_05495 [Colwelliaceae bacterium 6471]
MFKKYAKEITFSLVLHTALLLMLISQQFKITETKTPSKKAIKSYLYQVKKTRHATEKKRQPEAIVAPSQSFENKTASTTEQTSNASINNSKITKPMKNKVMDNNSFVKNDTRLEKSIITTKRKPALSSPPSPKISASKALERLRSSINESAQTLSAKEQNNERLAKKNSIAKSTRAFIKKPLVKKTNIDCNSNLNSGVAAISAILGGTVVCQKQPEIDGFINERLSKMGIKKKK